MIIEKNNLFTIFLSTIGILVILDAYQNQWIHPGVAIFLTSAIMAYFLVSGLIDRKRETNRIINSKVKHWRYKSNYFNWNSIIMTVILLFGQSKIEGTLKYIILIQGIIFLLSFLCNTLMSNTYNLQLLAVESNKLIDIKNKIEVIDLSKFQMVEKTEDMISFKNWWRTIKIFKMEFSNADDIIEAIQSELKNQNK